MVQMDNILKLLIGVLSFAGLLAMLTPSQLTTAKLDPVPVSEPAPVAPTESAPAPDEPVGEEPDEDVFQIGEPTIDGQPITDGESAPQDNNNSYINDTPSEPAPVGSGGYAQPAQYGFAPQQGNSAEMPPAG